MSLSDYEETLRSYIYDDEKLVTYKWLSKEMEIHVNLAKDILKQYWTKYCGQENLVATFLLIGHLKDKSIRVEVIKESNLNAAKIKFVKIDCEHLYSLQKTLPNIELLAFAGEGDLRYSAIKCNTEYIRSDEEIKNLRYVSSTGVGENKSPIPNLLSFQNSKTQIPKQDFALKLKPKHEEKKHNDSLEDCILENTKSNLKDNCEVKANVIEKKVSPMNKLNNNINSKSSIKLQKKPIQSKQSGFNNLFGNTTNKSQKVTKPINNNTGDQKETKSSSNENTDIKIFNEKIKTINENNSQLENETESVKIDVQKKFTKPERKSKINSKSVNKDNNKSSNDNSHSKKRNRNEEISTSKRKRIVVEDSSEDEFNNSDIDEEHRMDVEEMTKTVKERLPSPPTEKHENGKRMIRKTIDKTFRDEDGYLVTKMVHIYEVASDNEELTEVVKEEKKPKQTDNKAKKQTDNKAKKQTSLMNFFKKS